MKKPIILTLGEWSSSIECPCGAAYERDGTYNEWMADHAPHSDGTLLTTHDDTWPRVYAYRPDDVVHVIETGDDDGSSR